LCKNIVKNPISWLDGFKSEIKSIDFELNSSKAYKEKFQLLERFQNVLPLSVNALNDRWTFDILDEKVLGILLNFDGKYTKQTREIVQKTKLEGVSFDLEKTDCWKTVNRAYIRMFVDQQISAKGSFEINNESTKIEYKEYEFDDLKFKSTPLKSIFKGRFKISIPNKFKDKFMFVENKFISGIQKSKLLDYNIFIPSYNRSKEALICYEHLFDDNSQYNEIIVVRESQLEDYQLEHGNEKIIWSLPNSMNFYEVPVNVSSGIGFARLSIQILSSALHLPFIWMFDDNVIPTLI
jgi:hypothetical protein